MFYAAIDKNHWSYVVVFLSGSQGIEGSIDMNTVGGSSSGGSAYGVRKRGMASSMLETRGFGWLLEDEEPEEEDQRPLL